MADEITRTEKIKGQWRSFKMYTCKHCGKEFESRADQPCKFCSHECYADSLRGRTLYSHVCKICGKEYKNPKRKSTYCCIKCQGLGKKGAKHPLYKGGHTINDHGYEETLDDKRGYIPTHRKVVEDAVGRILDRSENIHHINEDIRDNRLENLVILTSSEHARIHNYLRGNGHMTEAEYQAIIKRGKERITG